MPDSLSDLVEKHLSPADLEQYTLIQQREAVRTYCQSLPGVRVRGSQDLTFNVLWESNRTFARLFAAALPASLLLECDKQTVAVWHARYPVIALRPFKTDDTDTTRCLIALNGEIPPEYFLDMINTAYQYQVRQLDAEEQALITEFLDRKPADEAKIRRLIAFHGLGHRTDEILALVQPAIRIRAVPFPPYDTVPGFASKFGGYADFPPDMPYPFFGKLPLIFVAQLNLSDVPAQHPSRSLLPAAGMLYFFVRMTSTDDDLLNRGAVLYYGGDLTKSRRASPPDWRKWFTFEKEAAMEFLDEQTLPDATDYKRDPIVDSLNWSADELEKLATVSDSLRTIYDDAYEHIAAHQMFGYPRSEQQGVRDNLRDVVLMQVDSDYHKLGFMWADGGTLSYILTQAQLAAGKFEKVRLDSSSG